MEAARVVASDGPAATRRLAASLGHAVAPGDVIALRGELGAGKTCFVQGLAEGLEVRGSRVASPTFNIVLEHAGRLPLYHVDLYRVASRSELEGLGLETYLYGAGVCAVEWIDRFPELLPRDYIDVALAITGARGRTLTVRGHGGRGVALAGEWLATPRAGRGGGTRRGGGAT